MRTARAKGLDERIVVLRHALRNALMPVITLGALEFGTLLSGAVLTEQVFTIPGFGKLIVDAVFNRDYAVVQGVVLFTATAYVTLNLLADLAYFLVNPRMRGMMAAFGRSLADRCARRRAARPPSAARGGAPGARAEAARGALLDCVVVFFVVLALFAPVDLAAGSARDQLERVRKAPSRGALVRHRRDRPRRAGARDLGHARVAARRRRVGVASRSRSAFRSGSPPATSAAGPTR